MNLNGSCHCGAIRFEVEAPHPVPFNRCYCSICRKTGGGGGFAINLGARYDTLSIRGEEHLSKYRAKIEATDGSGMTESPAERSFCSNCGSCLWVWDPRWPELVHPFASAIDSELPASPTHTHMMLNSKADWVPVDAAPNDAQFEQYPNESLAEWHQRQGLNE